MTMMFGNKNEYDIEIKKYNNDTRKIKINKILKSFEMNIKRFSYRIEEIVFELSNLYDFALRYYSRYLLNLVFKYQKNKKSLIHGTYKFLLQYTNKEESKLLCDDYVEYVEYCTTVINKKCFSFENINQKVRNFFSKFATVFDIDEIIKYVIEKECYDEIMLLIENDDLQGLLMLSYEHGIINLFLYLYIFHDVHFDYLNLIYARNYKKDGTAEIEEIEEINCSLSVKVESGSENATEKCSVSVFESIEKIKLIGEIFYLRRYSKINNKISCSTYYFNKDNLGKVKYFYGRDVDVMYKCIKSPDN